MARSARFENPEFPFHITARAHRKKAFPTRIAVTWEVMQRGLFALHHFYKVEIISFVLMPNHFHLLARFPESNKAAAMLYFMHYTSREMNQLSGQINQNYGGPYFCSLIRETPYFFAAYKYVYRNPVAAGLSPIAELYPYSTLSGLLGLQHQIIPLEPDETLINDPEGTLKWLNEELDERVAESIHRGLKRREFNSLQTREPRRSFVNDFALDAIATPNMGPHLLRTFCAPFAHLLVRGSGSGAHSDRRGDSFGRGF